jgi:hypothetical protein
MNVFLTLLVSLASATIIAFCIDMMEQYLSQES